MRRHALIACVMVLSLIGASAAETISYTYDDLGRIVRVEYSNGCVIVYAYDPAGNRSTVSQTNCPG